MGKARVAAIVVFALLCTVPLWAAWTIQPGLKEAPGKGHTYDDFGFSVSIGGNVLVVGALGAIPPGATITQGAAYIFVNSGSGWPTAPTAVLSEAPQTTSDSFGGSVAISPDGTTVVVGADTHSVSSTQQSVGAAFVFVMPAGGWATASSYTPTAQLSDSDGMTGDFFGTSVVINSTDNTIVVGATQVQSSGPGAAYVFQELKTGWQNTSTFAAKLTASNGFIHDYLGASVAIGGNTVVVGAPYGSVSDSSMPCSSCGVVYVFEKGTKWTTETETAQLYASNGFANSQLGASVAISGQILVAGAPGADFGSNTYQGAAYVFNEPSGGWGSESQTAELSASDGAELDELGSAVAISGHTVIAGVPNKTVGSNEYQGEVYVFTDTATGWKQTGLVLRAGAAGDRLGTSVSYYLSPSITGALVAGAPYRTVGKNTSQGEAFVWEQ